MPQAEFPLLIGSAADAALVRQLLREASFSEESIFKAAKIESMNEVGGIDLRTIDFIGMPSAFETLFRLFFGQRALERADVERGIGPLALATLQKLGLVAGYGSDQVYGQVLLYPVAEFHIASDRHSNPDGSEFHESADIVFPAIYGGTLRYLRLLPKSGADSGLDLCAGSGIGAFLMSRTCRTAVSSDLTPRATHFAEFNRWLNGIENAEVVCGDLYSGVVGRTFDRIGAHPPYVPSLDTTTIWRDGGVTGEEIARRIIEGLPEFLRPGGIATILSLGVDLKDKNFEQRAREWLGKAAGEFDIIFAASDERTPAEVLRDMVDRDPYLPADKLQGLRTAFADLRIERMPHGATVLRRRTADETHEPWTYRTRLAEATDGEDFELAFKRHRRFESSGFLERLPDERPRLSKRLQVIATHVVHEGNLVPAEFIFETDKPFDVRGRVDGWMVPMFVRLDGKQTVKEVFEHAAGEGDLPSEFKLNDFCGLVARMVERGFLELL